MYRRDTTAERAEKKQKINRAKAYLKEISVYDKELVTLSDAIVALSMEQMSMTNRMDMMRAESLLLDLEDRYEETLSGQMRRIKAIYDIGFGRHVDILHALYIDCASIRTVADTTGRDERQIRRMRDRALLRIRLPEE